MLPCIIHGQKDRVWVLSIIRNTVVEESSASKETPNAYRVYVSKEEQQL